MTGWDEMPHPDPEQAIPDAATHSMGADELIGEQREWRRPAEPDTALRNRIVAAVEREQRSSSGSDQIDRARALAITDAVMGVLSAAPPERGPAWAADGSRDSVWVIGERVVQRGPDQTVLLDGERVEYPLALAAALRCATHSSDYWDQLAEREAPTPASVRAAALRRIGQREATPGDPADGPYPASVGEVADELAGLVVELDAGPARGLVRELAARLPEREAPSRDWGLFDAQLRKLVADTIRELPALREQKPYSQMLDHSARATDQIVDGVRRLMDGEQLFPVSSGISVEGGQR
jgi:hypothetical protein